MQRSELLQPSKRQTSKLQPSKLLKVYVLLDTAMAALDLILPAHTDDTMPPRTAGGYSRPGGYRLAKDRLSLNSEARAALDQAILAKSLRQNDGSAIVDMDLFLEYAIQVHTIMMQWSLLQPRQ
jgi:hypothetical protein